MAQILHRDKDQSSPNKKPQKIPRPLTLLKGVKGARLLAEGSGEAAPHQSFSLYSTLLSRRHFRARTIFLA